MGKIIAVVGIDGSGKSTLIDKVGFKSFHFYELVRNSSKKRVVTNKKYYKLRFFVGTILKIYLPNLLKYVKYKFFSESLVVFDRYSYDYLISLRKEKSIYNTILYHMFYFFPSPDLVIFLKVSPEVAFERKKEFDVKYLDNRQKALSHVLKLVKSSKLKVIDSSINIEKAYDFFKE